MSIVFDTLKFVKAFKKEGFSESQAEVLVTLLQESHEFAGLATKADLEKLAMTLAGFATKADLEKLALKLTEFATKADLENFATKADLENLRHEVKAGDTELSHEIKKLELRMDGEMKLLKWMMTVAISGIVTVIGGVVMLIFKAFFP